MKNVKFILTILLIVSVYLSLTAQSDTIQENDLVNMTFEELTNIKVSGVSRYEQNLSDIPNFIQVISQQQITNRRYHDLSDLLKDVQGFDITSNVGRFGEYYSFRGVSGNDRFLILINGHKLNPASGTFISVGNSISIRYAERVEIVYGPGSAIYGADAFSGIINIVFKDNILDGNKFNISGYTNYGSMNTIDGAFNSSIKINNNFSFNFSARLYKSDGFDPVGKDTIYNIINSYTSPITNKCEQPINDHNIYLNANFKNFSVNYYRQQFCEGNAFGHNPTMYIYDKINKWKFSTDIIWVAYKKGLNNKGNLYFDISYKRYMQDNNTVFHKWLIPGVIGDTYKQFMTGKDNTIHAVLTYNQLISDKFQFIAGIDNEYTNSIPPYANDEVLGKSDKYEGNNAKLIDEQLTISENRFSCFGQFTYSPFNFVNLIIGARYDYSTRYKGVFNPRVGLIISPAKSTKIKFLYGRAFQAPSLFYQYEQFGAPTTTMLSTAEIQKTNPSWKLENQVVNSYEVNLTQRIAENYEFNVDVYYNTLINLIERNLFASYPTDSVYNKYYDNYSGGLRNENLGSQKILGGDFSLNAKITKNILIYSYYSYIKALSVLQDGTERKIPRISNHKIWVGFTAFNIFKFITVSSRFRWLGDMYNFNTEMFADNIQKGFCTIDLNISFNNLSSGYRIYANFENILNRKIEHAGLFYQSGVHTSVIHQPGFVFSAGIEIYFNK